MTGILVVVGLLLAALAWRVVVRARRRRADRTMIVTTIPAIELEQPYGGWNAEAYDAGTGHGAPRGGVSWYAGLPSNWPRLP